MYATTCAPWSQLIILPVYFSKNTGLVVIRWARIDCNRLSDTVLKAELGLQIQIKVVIIPSGIVIINTNLLSTSETPLRFS